MADRFQQEIITSRKNQLVIAGPGSGKTTTIINRIEFLSQFGYQKDILVLSFTNKSVEDIKSRLYQDIYVTTFHKLAIDILKNADVYYQICYVHLLDYIVDEYFKRFSKKDLNRLCNYLGVAKLEYKSPEYISFRSLIKTFINLFKTNNKDMNTLYNLVNDYDDKYLIKIILDIFLEYEKEKNSTNSYDFDDLIVKSTMHLKENYDFRKFKFIIIDEFQDTSMIRLNLIKTIYDNSDAIITAVGDDAQSIYHFSGCDLNIFLNFEKYFPGTEKVFLKHTYRNSQTMVDISEGFINKNKYQLVKNMISRVPDNMPIEIVSYINAPAALSKLFNSIWSNDILILGRNKNDINIYLNDYIKLNKDTVTYKGRNFKYMTIHSSKGLEAEYVIILNVSDSLLGLPNKLEDHPILKYVSGDIDDYPFSEERRVFFVALTRCKRKVFILTPYSNPSPFIKEIKKMLLEHL